MHFFRIKIKRRPSLTTDQINSSPISGRRSRVPSPVISQPRFKSSIWKLLPFVGKVSKRYSTVMNGVSSFEAIPLFNT